MVRLTIIFFLLAGIADGGGSTRRPRHINPRFAGATLVLDARRIAATDGASVTTWSDASGAANNATQATAGKKPTYKAAIQGGQPVVRFDGADDSLAYTTALWTYTGASTVVALLKASGGASNFGSVIAEYGGVTASIGCQMTVFPNAGPELCTDVYAPGGMRYNSTQSGSLFHVTAWRWTNWSTHKTNGATSLGVNGVHVAGTAYGSNPASLTSTTKRVGSFGESANSFFIGDIGSLAVIPVALEPPLRRRLEHALALSWKVACQ